MVAAGYDKATLQANWLKSRLLDGILNVVFLLSILLTGGVVLRQVRININNQTELTHLRDELTSINHTLQAMAMVDGLTGLANRRQFDIFLRDSLNRSARSGKPVSLVMLDIDFFKQYNDTYGHVAGDKCLEAVSGALRGLALRGTHMAARYGGEEFALILPDTPASDALSLAWCAVEAVRRANLPHRTTALPARTLTISAGCATLTGSGSDADIQQLKQWADAALYAAKREGRNQAVEYNCTLI